MWEANVRRVTPYTPGEQPKIANLIKLNTNENPYPPAPAVQAALSQMDVSDFRLYPDPECEILERALADFYHVKTTEVFTGVGSDDVLAMSFLTFFNGKEPIIFPDITYSFYDVWANLFRIPYEQIPLRSDFTLRVNDYIRPNGGIVIANPNAPTGLSIGLEAIEEIVAANPQSVVIVDEAYVDFGCESALPLIYKYENLLVVQTFSKSRSMAGIRIGYAFGCEKLIKYLKDVKFAFNSYTMNMPTLTLGAMALSDRDYFYKTIDKVVATREWTKTELKKLGFTFGDSQTNFIFAKHDRVARDEIFKKLRENNILVRAFNGERIKDYLRISIGTDAEMQTLIDTLRKIVGE